MHLCIYSRLRIITEKRYNKIITYNEELQPQINIRAELLIATGIKVESVW